MPTPSPIIVASIGEIDGTSVKPDITPIKPSPMKMPNSAEPIGMPAAITEPNATRSTMMATARPTISPPSTSSDPLHDRARQLGLQTGVAGDLDGGLGCLAFLGPGRIDAVANRRVGDPPVGADRRVRRVVGIGHGEHVGADGDLAERLGDRRTSSRIGDVTVRIGEHDLTTDATLGREALLEQVDAALGLGAGDREVVTGLAADGSVETEDRDRDHDPRADHPPWVQCGSPPPPVQDLGHLDAPHE